LAPKYSCKQQYGAKPCKAEQATAAVAQCGARRAKHQKFNVYQAQQVLYAHQLQQHSKHLSTNSSAEPEEQKEQKLNIHVNVHEAQQGSKHLSTNSSAEPQEQKQQKLNIAQRAFKHQQQCRAGRNLNDNFIHNFKVIPHGTRTHDQNGSGF
jgi:hypothetical protein